MKIEIIIQVVIITSIYNSIISFIQNSTRIYKSILGIPDFLFATHDKSPKCELSFLKVFNELLDNYILSCMVHFI